MKSRMTIDFQGVDAPQGSTAQFEPVIRISIDPSDDVRDKLLSSFFQALGGSSSWLRVEFVHSEPNSSSRVNLYPVIPSELATSAVEMRERARDYQGPLEYQQPSDVLA